MEAKDKIAEDLEDAARRHNIKILYWYVNKLRENGQSELAPIKEMNWATISDKGRVEQRWREHIENVLKP